MGISIFSSSKDKITIDIESSLEVEWMIKEKIIPSCQTEYDALQAVVLCKPSYMKISEVINETQVKYAEENIDTKVAVEQFDALVQLFEEHYIQVIQLPPSKQYPEQVFTRDIAFTLEKQLFVAKLHRKIRQGEEEVFIEWAKKNDLSYRQITKESIEGGDVIIDRDTVWVGDSSRTSRKAIQELQEHLTDHQVIKVEFPYEYLHLDCVFNVVSPTEALIYPSAFHKEDLERFQKKYNLIEVSEEEQFTLGTNVLSIGNKKIISQPVNKEVNKQLRKRGYTVLEVDISEIIKSGGAFRCITMPLSRG